MFRDEYKNEMDKITPSDKLIDNLSKEMAQTAAKQNEESIDSFRRSGRRFSLAGKIAAVAAGILIVGGMVLVVPIIMSDNMVSKGESIHSGMGNNAVDDLEPDNAPSENRPDGNIKPGAGGASTTDAAYDTPETTQETDSATENTTAVFSTPPIMDSDSIGIGESLNFYLNSIGNVGKVAASYTVLYENTDATKDKEVTVTDSAVLDDIIQSVSGSLPDKNGFADKSFSERVTISYNDENKNTFLQYVFTRFESRYGLSVVANGKTTDFNLRPEVFRAAVQIADSL